MGSPLARSRGARRAGLHARGRGDLPAEISNEARGRARAAGAAVGKLARLERIIARCGSALVAFSGGVDSTFLLSVAKDVLGKRLLAATVAFPLVQPAEVRHAAALARRLGVAHRTIRMAGILREPFRDNPPDRCYHCKRVLFSKLSALARERGLGCVLEASNADDTRDYRPGLRAVGELGVRSPLIEAGFTKAEIRALSRERNLPTWNKPALACLATRIPYGERITKEKLERVAKGEEYLLSLGFGACRLRLQGEIARIEVPEDEIDRLLESGLRRRIASRLRKLGFRYVTVDLEGYRSGSMNEALMRKQGRGTR
jgi:uncharacterized protein